MVRLAKNVISFILLSVHNLWNDLTLLDKKLDEKDIILGIYYFLQLPGHAGRMQQLILSHPLWRVSPSIFNRTGVK